MRDLARALQSRGHLVFAFSSDPRQRERLLERDLIAVATALDELPFRPDIIHAQHHLDAMTALTALSDVPAVYHEHGGPWQDSPPEHPRIYRFLAASQTLAEGMRAHLGTARASDVTPWLLPIDQSRLLRIKTLPTAPERALFFHDLFPESGRTLIRVREAAARSGLTLDIAGREFGCGHEEGEEILPQYDVVVASGRVAAEALACGCAVITYGPAGYGEMVGLENYERLRAQNFTPAPEAHSVSFDDLEILLRSYHAEAGAQLAARIRADVEFPKAVDDLLSIYQNVITRHQQAQPDPLAELQATSNYLRNLAPRIMRASNRPGGLMRAEITWKPTALPNGRNPQK